MYSVLVFAAFLYADWLLRGLGRALFLWQPVFRFADAAFVLGLAAFLIGSSAPGTSGARILSASATAVLILWNLGLIFQWGTHLIPARGPISWRDAAYNQVAVVPVEALAL